MLLRALSCRAPRKCPSCIGGRVEPLLKATLLMQFSWLSIETGPHRVSTLQINHPGNSRVNWSCLERNIANSHIPIWLINNS